MARDYETLIRLNRWKVDERSRELNALQGQAQKLKDQDKMLVDRLEYEREAAKSSLEASAMFGPFSNGIGKQRNRIAADLRQLARKIDEARDNLRAAMGEVKKFEIAEANARAIEARELAAKESQLLDETALSGFRRKQEEAE